MDTFINRLLEILALQVHIYEPESKFSLLFCYYVGKSKNSWQDYLDILDKET